MGVFLLFAAVKLAFEKILITVLFWKRFIFLSLVYAYVHKCTCAPGSQRRSLDALFVRCPGVGVENQTPVLCKRQSS